MKKFTCRAEYADGLCGGHELRAGMDSTAEVEIEDNGMMNIISTSEPEIDKTSAYCGDCGEPVDIWDEKNFTK